MTVRRLIIELGVFYVVGSVIMALIEWALIYFLDNDGIAISGLLATIIAISFVGARHVSRQGGELASADAWKVAAGGTGLIILWDLVTTFLFSSLLSAAGEPGLFEVFREGEGGFLILGLVILFIYGIVFLMLRFYLPMTIRRELKRRVAREERKG